MVRHGELSHQYAGEPELVELLDATARTSPRSPKTLPSRRTRKSWRRNGCTRPHRHNILDPRLTTIGIGLVRQGNNMWAVEDFSAAVAQMGSTQIEQKIEQLIAARGIR